MTYVTCEQQRYTWAERRLEGSGAGFGVVLRSTGWPVELMQDPELRQVLTELSLSARRLSPDGPEAFLTHLRRAGGSLLVAKRPVGTDGAGRPGNYCIHALFDPTCTLGALDLEPLLVSGTFRLEREVDTSPDAGARPLQVWVPEDWSDQRKASRRRLAPGRASTPPAGPLRQWDVAELHETLQNLCQVMPADLVNQLEVLGGHEANESPALEEEPSTGKGGARSRHRSALQLGAADQPMWWERRGLAAADWDTELDGFILLHQPVDEVPDGALWDRWDRSDATGRWDLANELLDRPGLAKDDEAGAAVATRPSLLDDIIEAGLLGDAARRSAAAHWVAAVGSDAQALDLAAELLVAGPAGQLPAALVDRLTEREPDELPAAVVDAVAAALDGSASVPAAWRVTCLRRYLLGQPGGGDSESLAAACSDGELNDAVRDAVEQGASLDQCWDRLGELVSSTRRDRSFATASSDSAGYLLRHAPSGSPRSRAHHWQVLWPLVAVTSGWSPAVRDLFAEGRRRERSLRVQRTVLLVVTVVLALAVAVLAWVVARQIGP